MSPIIIGDTADECFSAEYWVPLTILRMLKLKNEYCHDSIDPISLTAVQGRLKHLIREIQIIHLGQSDLQYCQRGLCRARRQLPIRTTVAFFYKQVVRFRPSVEYILFIYFFVFLLCVRKLS